jgi:hypothetical protein
MNGIDFAKDVKLVELKKGTEVMTWAKIDSPVAGKYFSTSIRYPAKLGIGSLSVTRDGSVVSKELRVFELEKDVSALESTAGPMNDTFSIPIAPGQPVPTEVAGSMGLATRSQICSRRHSWPAVRTRLGPAIIYAVIGAQTSSMNRFLSLANDTFESI